MNEERRRRSREELARTAYHEAGHAVALVVRGLAVTSVTIKPGGDSLGRCIHPGVLGYEYQGERARRQIARDSIVSCYAGLQAEVEFDPRGDETRSRGDEGNAFEISREYCVMPRRCGFVGDDAHWTYLKKLQREARQLVRAHWGEVEAVAEALLEHRVLSADQVKAIVAEAALPRVSVPTSLS